MLCARYENAEAGLQMRTTSSKSKAFGQLPGQQLCSQSAVPEYRRTDCIEVPNLYMTVIGDLSCLGPFALQQLTHPST